MRIIAGTWKGRRLEAPTWDGLRPTSDKLRETLFNVIAARVPGARMLDLYCGTGAVGLEALSRGASAVVAIDADPRAVALARRNAATCGATADYTIHSGDAVLELSRRAAAGTFDLVFLDPPYAFENTREALSAVAAYVSRDGLVILERATRVEVDVPDVFDRVRDVRSGDSSLTLLVPRAEAP
jgi:16S rRNA (guanine(966)-N(2))-methyltransferase RsmD